MVIPALLSSAKFYVGLGVVALVGVGLWRIDYLTKENARLEANVRLAEWSVEETNRLRDEERQKRVDAENRRAERLARIEEVERENQKYRDCVAAGTCGVRVVRASCPGVPSTGAGASGTAEGAPILDAALQQDIFNLRAELKKLEIDFESCRQEVIARSAPLVPAK